MTFVLLIVISLLQQADLPSTPPTSTSAQALSPAGPEVESFIREVLEERLQANAVAGYRLNGRSGKRVPILEELSRSRLRLSAGALPRFRDYEFYLLSSQEAQAQADRSGEPLISIRLDQPLINGIEGSLSIGADLTLPSQSDLMSLCCCRETAHFVRIEERWVFARRSDTICR